MILYYNNLTNRTLISSIIFQKGILMETNENRNRNRTEKAQRGEEYQIACSKVKSSFQGIVCDQYRFEKN